LERGIVEINGSQIPMRKGDMDMDCESPEDMETPTIRMISRKTLKELRHDQIEELYLARIRDDDTEIGISATSVQELGNIPPAKSKFILSGVYSTIFRRYASCHRARAKVLLCLFPRTVFRSS
jgi:hypothetical protein